MIKIISDELAKEIWDFIFEKYKFNPSTKTDTEPFVFDVKVLCFKLKSIWNEEQELIVNDFFKKNSSNEIYALDWQHDCFEYNPHNYNEMKKQWFDQSRDCYVYFPSYYPNGDYFFFVSKDFRYGLLGHPWRKEIYVFGDTLIEQFKHNEELLNIIQNDL